MNLGIWDLGVMISKDGSGKTEIASKVVQKRRTESILRVVNGNNLNVESARSLLVRELIPSLMCGCETVDFHGPDR